MPNTPQAVPRISHMHHGLLGCNVRNVSELEQTRRRDRTLTENE